MCTLTVVGLAAALAGCGASARHPLTTAGVQSRGFGTCAGRLGTQGSLGGVPVPFPPQVFRLTNMWLAKCHGIYIDVYAGSSLQWPKQGALLVIWTNPNIGTPEPRSGTFRTGWATGPLTLTRVRGNTVHFRFAGGTGTLDLRARRFVFR